MITCPKCAHKFEPTESMQKQIRAELEAKFETQRVELEEEFITKAKQNDAKIKARAVADARTEAAATLLDITSQLDAERERVKEAQAKELELRKAQRTLESDKAAFELQMTRKMDEERAKIKVEAEGRVADEYALREQDWAKQRGDMAKQIDDLKRRADQIQSQTTGEVLELEIENAIIDTFIYDEVVPVAKGVKGGDIQQRVQTQGGAYAGSILWELKRTKSWSEGWIQKIKDDQREAKADIAVIVTAVLPKDVKHIGFVDGVWVVDFQSYLGVASVLRAGLFEVAKARAAGTGKKDKATALYDYVTGNEFRGHVEQVVEAFAEMQEDLVAEKRALERTWAKREKQAARAMSGMAAMYGDMQGRVGRTMEEIKALTLEEVA